MDKRVAANQPDIVVVGKQSKTVVVIDLERVMAASGRMNILAILIIF